MFRWKCLGFRPLLSLWYAFNILAMGWFGFLHQAGVMPVQKFIAGKVRLLATAPFTDVFYTSLQIFFQIFSQFYEILYNAIIFLLVTLNLCKYHTYLTVYV